MLPMEIGETIFKNNNYQQQMQTKCFAKQVFMVKMVNNCLRLLVFSLIIFIRYQILDTIFIANIAKIGEDLKYT